MPTPCPNPGCGAIPSPTRTLTRALAHRSQPVRCGEIASVPETETHCPF
ncbi:MAG TPA: hypothetical protein PKG95_11935 [Anaerolineaceae bacterium]|nr:hypothetical protein [Anaerolineaceae bacterium]